MMASPRTALTSSGRISGFGLASARISGFGAICLATMSCFSTPPADRPRKMSAPGITSARVRCGGVLGEAFLVRIHQLGAALVDHAGQVGHVDVLDREAEVDDQVEAGQRRRARARHHQLAVPMSLPTYLHAVQDGGADDDRGAVLVVVEDRDLHALAQLALDVEALGRLDVFQVDAAEGRLQRGDDVDQLVRVVSLISMSNTSMPANFLNSTPLPSMTGLEASGPMLPRPSTAVPLVMTATRLPRAVYL
jgi:hypothetical protein